MDIKCTDKASFIFQEIARAAAQRGYKTADVQEASFAVIAFLVPATLVAHEFWGAVGTPAFAPQLLQFLKNTAMTGGLLLIAATPNQPQLFPRASHSKDGK